MVFTFFNDRENQKKAYHTWKLYEIQISVSVSTMLECSHIHLFKYCLQLLSCRVEELQQKLYT